MLSFNPDEIKPNTYTPRPILTGLKIKNKWVKPGDSVYGKVVLSKDIAFTNKIRLPHFLNDFTIEFSALHYKSPKNNSFKYKLDGFNENWVTTKANRNFATYTGLQHGTYTFHLRAYNPDGVANKAINDVRLQIEIIPAFYETLLFKIGLSLLFIFASIAIYRFRLKAMRNRNQILEVQVKSRTQELHSANDKLAARQEEIIAQNEELSKHRNNLEKLVFERTEKLSQALKKAEESDRLKTAFLSNMSHEIRTPMNAILGFPDLLLLDDLSSEEKQNYTQLIRNNGESLLNLLNDIIDISIIESGQLQIHISPVDVRQLVTDIVSLYQLSKGREPDKDLVIVADMSKLSEGTLETDKHRLRQILDNLISNALKFTSQGSILLAVQETGTHIQFAVKDTGIGIAAEQLDHIFDRFRKLDNEQSEFQRGGGLGLSICKNLVQQLGGSIWVKSNPNIGSTFYFTLPKND